MPVLKKQMSKTWTELNEINRMPNCDIGGNTSEIKEVLQEKTDNQLSNAEERASTEKSANFNIKKKRKLLFTDFDERKAERKLQIAKRLEKDNGLIFLEMHPEAIKTKPKLGKSAFFYENAKK